MLATLEMPVTSSMYHRAVEHQNALDDPLDIVLVEDMHSDAMLTKISLNASKIPYNLTLLRRGELLMPSLRKQGTPDLILLDLGLPDMDGFEILAALSEQSANMRAVPIVILTGHQHFEYVRKIYPLHIMGYINKPCNAQDMRDVLTRIQRGRRNDMQVNWG